jgi:hypothetical protein
VSLIRELIDPEAFQENAARELMRVALLIRRAGLEHLVQASPEDPLERVEIEALAAAGDELEAGLAKLVAEHLVELLEEIGKVSKETKKPASAAALDRAFELARSRQGGH